jgi:hypothetical protein
MAAGKTPKGKTQPTPVYTGTLNRLKGTEERAYEEDAGINDLNVSRM